MISDSRLLVCVQRIRIRAELFLGLTAQLKDDPLSAGYAGMTEYAHIGG